MGNIQDLDIDRKSTTVFLAGSSRFDYKSVSGFAIVAAVEFCSTMTKVA